METWRYSINIALCEPIVAVDKGVCKPQIWTVTIDEISASMVLAGLEASRVAEAVSVILARGCRAKNPGLLR